MRIPISSKSMTAPFIYNSARFNNASKIEFFRFFLKKRVDKTKNGSIMSP